MGLDKRILAVFVIILIFAFAGGVKYAEMKQARLSDAEDLTLSITGEQEEDEENTEPAEKETEIKVYITGEVKNPGVYTFSSGARIYEAIELACPLENAELKYMEMARILKDEETIYVPALGEMEGPQEEILFSASASQDNPQRFWWQKEYLKAYQLFFLAQLFPNLYMEYIPVFFYISYP